MPKPNYRKRLEVIEDSSVWKLRSIAQWLGICHALKSVLQLWGVKMIPVQNFQFLTVQTLHAVLRRTYAYISATFFLFAFCSVSYAQYSEDEILSEMERLYSSEAFIKNVVAKQNVAEHQRNAYEEHMRLLFHREGVVEFLATEAFALRDYLSEQDTHERAAAFGAALIQEKAGDGIKRLDVDAQRIFWSSAYKIFSVVSYDDCASLFMQTADAQAMSAIEIKGASILSEAEIRAYLNVTRQAIFAEIFDDPVYTPLGKTEREIATQVFEAAFVENLLTHPRSEALINAAEMHEGLPSKDVCEFGLLSISTALNIRGAAGNWVLKYLGE